MEEKHTKLRNRTSAKRWKHIICFFFKKKKGEIHVTDDFQFFKETKVSVNLFSDFPSIPRFSACRQRGSGGKEQNPSSQWDARKASTRPGRRRQIVFGDCLPSFIWWGGEVFGTQTRKSIMVATDGLFDFVSVSGLRKNPHAPPLGSGTRCCTVDDVTWNRDGCWAEETCVTHRKMAS